MSAISRPTMLARVWSRYLVALREHPVRTRMVTSGVLYVVGDGVAQFGIEGRKLDLQGEEPDERLVWDVSGPLSLAFARLQLTPSAYPYSEVDLL
jgi:protein Mpv17